LVRADVTLSEPLATAEAKSTICFFPTKYVGCGGVVASDGGDLTLDLLARDGVAWAKPLARLWTVDVLIDFPVVPHIFSPSQQSLQIVSGVFPFSVLQTTSSATRLSQEQQCKHLAANLVRVLDE
jgi:hypothetical protein